MTWLSVGIIWTIAFGVVALIALCLRLRFFSPRLPEESGLTWADRRAAYAAAVRGRVVADPRLAVATYAHAVRIEDRLRKQTRLPYVLLRWCSTALFIGIAVLSVNDGDWPLGASNLVAAAFIGIAPVVQLRSLRRVRYALELNGPLLPAWQRDQRQLTAP